MSDRYFPDLISALPVVDERFRAFLLEAQGCDVLFASYPAGTEIEPHTHDTENCGVITAGALYLTVDGVETRYGPGEWYHLRPGQEHAARFEEDTAEIEFWFER